MQNVIDAGAVIEKNCPLWMAISAPKFPCAFFSGLAIRLLQHHEEGDISYCAAQFFKNGTKVVVQGHCSPSTESTCSGNLLESSQFSQLTIRSSHTSGLESARRALERHLKIYPGLAAHIEMHQMCETVIQEWHEPVSVLVASNTLFNRYESNRDARSRASVAAALSNKASLLTILHKAEMENLRSEELRRGRGVNPRVSDAQSRFLGFEARGKHGIVHVHVNPAKKTIDIHDDMSIFVANEFFRLGELGYFEIEIEEIHAERWALECAFVTREFSSVGHRNRLGDCQHSWCVDNRVHKAHDGSRTVFGKPWKAGDVIGLACDLQVGLVRVAVNGDFAAPNGIAFAVSLVSPGLYPAFSANSVKVRYNLNPPFLHPAPLIPFEEEDGETEMVRQSYVSLWESRVKAADIWEESEKVQSAKDAANRAMNAIEIMQMIERLCPREHSLEVTFPDSRFKTPARILVVIVDSDVAKARDDYQKDIEDMMGPKQGWDRHKYEARFQSYRKRLMPLRSLLVDVKRKSPDCVLLPILMPGWDSKGNLDWWPEGIVDLKKHPLAIELLPDKDSWLDAIQDGLVPNLIKCLSEWRGEESAVPRAICCKGCLAAGSTAPYCFDSDTLYRQLRRKLSKPSPSYDQGEEKCPDCANARRVPSSMEIVKPLLYISYCHGSTAHVPTKRVIEAVYQSVEAFFECVCFPSFAIGSQKPIQTQAGDIMKERLRRMRDSCCVIACLDDRYLSLENCVSEFREAIAQRKPIIPVLLPLTRTLEESAVQESSTHLPAAPSEGDSACLPGVNASAETWRQSFLERLYVAVAAGTGGEDIMDPQIPREEFFRRFAPVALETSAPGSEAATADLQGSARILAQVLANLHI